MNGMLLTNCANCNESESSICIACRKVEEVKEPESGEDIYIYIYIYIYICIYISASYIHFKYHNVCLLVLAWKVLPATSFHVMPLSL